MRRRPAHLLAVALATAAPLLAAPADSLARHGGDDGDEARVEGVCGRGADAELRLKADDGVIEVELRVDSRRSGEPWRVVLVHERRVAWRGNLRTRGGGSLRIRRTLPDYGGADQVTALASGPRGVSCQAGATLSGS